MHLHIFKKAVVLAIHILVAGYFCKAQDIPANQLVLPQANHIIPFIWAQDHTQHAAMLIPVKLKNCPKQFYMQFDTGSPYSLFYRNKLKSINSRYPQSVQVTDTTTMLPQFRFTAGSTEILAKEITVQQFDSTGINWHQDTMEIIGTLGTDFIDNKTVIINYPGKYLSIGSNIEANDHLGWSDFIYVRRSILLPASIKEKNTLVYFDTGSSAFELLTNKETAIALSSLNAVTTIAEVQSWGKTLKAVNVQTDDTITIASQKIPLQKVTYIEGVSESQVNAMKKMGIGGMVGNGLFLDRVLILDILNKKCCIREVLAADRF
ncbi:hypothetical protein [Chitinophaga sp. OAE865]|uniref:hypothetical protein n=1 Tax=Chitinophaga sp. OAE865 TaxID=2817898 RepID=UPI001AE51ACE